MKTISVLILFAAILVCFSSMLSQVTWTRYNMNPVLQTQTGDPNNPDQMYYAYSPSVLYDASSGMYKMWFTSLTNGDSYYDISYATSLDGKNWYLYAKNPVLTHGSSSDVDANIVAPDVAFDGTQYYMIYSTWSGFDCLATSPDGINWTKYAGNPVLGGGSSGWDQQVGPGSLVFDGSTFRFWYSGYISGPPYQTGYATSSDCIHWTKDPNNPVLALNSTGFDTHDAYDPCVIIKEGAYYMTYLGDSTACCDVSIGVATSTDGIHWRRFAGNPVLRPQGGAPWEDITLGVPSMLYMNGTFKLWYSGYDGQWQTGYAESPDVDLQVNSNTFTENVFAYNGTRHISLTFGAAGGATDGIDTSLGEYELPPVPPLGTFDARWLVASTRGSQIDLEDTLGADRFQNTYTGQVQPGTAGYPVLLQWDPSSLPTGTFSLQDAATHGSVYHVDMKITSSFSMQNGFPQPFEIVYSSQPSLQAVGEAGWNMVSVPVSVQNPTLSSVFPGASGHAFSFLESAGYKITDTLMNGSGYWVKFDTNQTLSVSGQTITADTIQVTPGWQMLGSLSSSINIGKITQSPDGILTSRYYTYTDSGYTAVDQIDPLRGYWVKAWANGMIIRSAGTKALTKTVANDKLTETLNSLRITDSRHKSQILYFGIQGMSVSNANLGRYILPPPSPGGTIDARFDGDQSVALFRVVASSPTSYRIHIRGAAYPLTISWKTNPAQGEYGEAVYSLFSSGTGALLTPNVIGTGSIQITNSNAGDLELTSMSSSGNTVPKQFELTQNFPNPFNPATTISYGLPSDGFVTLKIYNALGELVTTLVSGEQTRGRHLAVWNAGNYSSGIYWYRMVAPGFVATKQMVVMK